MRMVVVGGSIAAVTAAGALRSEGFDGEVTMLSAETIAPYSRVPLSKGVLAGTVPWASVVLPALPDDIDLRLGAAAVRLHTDRQKVELSDGELVPYDGLIIATGARARRLAAPRQSGELVVRTVHDARKIAAMLPASRTALVVGGGLLGMEIASTLSGHGLVVTVVDRDPPLQRLLGSWLADFVVRKAREDGVEIRVAPGGVELVGDPIHGVRLAGGPELRADLVITAAGDLPNVEWLASSGVSVAGGIVVDDRCAVADNIVAAGDVTVRKISEVLHRRTPHWTNAINQGRAAAQTLLDPNTAPLVEDYYIWTEQWGLDLKIAGPVPVHGTPETRSGRLEERTALLCWPDPVAPVVATVNHRMPVARLKAMART